MSRSVVNDIIVPDSEPTRQASPLRTSSQHAMETKAKVRVTYGRPKPSIPVVEEQQEDDLPPSSPPKIISSSSTLTEDSSFPLDDNSVRATSSKPRLLQSDEGEDGDTDGDGNTQFNWGWRKKLAALDASDDEEGPQAQPRATVHTKPRMHADIFSGSLPPLTSSSMQSTSPPRTTSKRPTSDRLPSPSSALVSPPRASTRETDESSGASEGPSKLFESPFNALAPVANTPDSSPLKAVSKPSDHDELEGLFSPAASVGRQSPAIPNRKQRLKSLASSRRFGQASETPSPEQGPTTEDANAVIGDIENSDKEKPKKKPKKLNKKEIDQMNKETARLLAAQDASIPRYENRLSLTSLFKTIQMANGSSELPDTPGTTQLKKLPRPSKPYVAVKPNAAPIDDDPIIDASSPFVRNVLKTAYAATIPSSSAPASSQVPIEASSTPALPMQRTMSAPLPVLPISNDPEEELPDADAVLAEDRERRLQAMRAEDEKRRQYKLALLQRRQEQSVMTAAELLREKDADSDSDIEIQEEEPELVKNGPGSAKKGFMDRLVHSMPGRKSHHVGQTPTDSQLNRAAKPHFDMSFPPSARKNGKKDPVINRDALNRSLLKKARRITTEETQRKEEEWKSRGGRKRQLKQEDISAAIQEALEKQVAAAEPSEDSGSDEDWAPSGEESEMENDENKTAPALVEDEAMDEDDENSPAPEDNEVSARSPSYADSNKENDNENKENVAPSRRSSRSVLGEMQIDVIQAEDAIDSDGEPLWPPRKKRKLSNGVGLLLDDDTESNNGDSTAVPIARCLFPDVPLEEDDAPSNFITGFAASLGDSAPDAFDPAFSNGLGGGGLSQFFDETQVVSGPLSQLRRAAAEELENVVPRNLLPSVDLSTQQIQLQEEVFQEDQESRLQDALRAASKEMNARSRPEASRLVLAESFQMDDFTQRDGLNSLDDFNMDGLLFQNANIDANDVESTNQPSFEAHDQSLETQSNDEMSTTDQDENMPPAPRELDAFEIMRRNARREAKKARRKKIRSLFMEGEAEEEEEEAMLGFNISKGEHESDEDSEDDVLLPELVDDKVMNEETVAKEKVLEKVAEHQAEDDAALEKYHMDAIEGKRRMRRRGDDFLSDSDDEGERRHYVPGMFRRKDGAPELVALAQNPQTRAFYEAYQNTVVAKDDHEFDHLNAAPPEDSGNEGDSDEENNENSRVRETVSAAQLRHELLQAARNKESISPLMNPDDASWVDQGDSDGEDVRHSYPSMAVRPRAREPPKASNDDDLLLSCRSVKLDAKQQARLEKFRKEDSYVANTSRGGAAVTGFVKNKAQLQNGSGKDKKGKAPAPRKSAVFERQGKFAS
ncbi:hypothetical protein DACRYDRAFT_111784 [Dacryopinax primogenitus]|uniref:DNA replication checkpoint mediator MRC1 domain-containing protein n=1 Tax=Dacryopinax primogenitus (strain DJM 731) TaxID=1858805 RepID=M5FWG0_DACPD|nr:uncharacterized protein DACRYDRAFT_111784 [Dacryopinax primogenitus]EJT97736.1 hypothetical protein DACRYDRAFT_111784 [Dacryopinax primogenitus]